MIYKPKIVISAINIHQGGTLSILQDCLFYAFKSFSKDFEIIALVHKKELIKNPQIIVYDFPYSRKSWLIRIFYEYLYFYFFSKKLKASLWLSLHDMSPNVSAKVKAVYCHNPSPFYKEKFKNTILDPTFAAFVLFYKFLYRINIKKNNFVIVQQNWIRQAFEKHFKLRKEKIIVAYPKININPLYQQDLSSLSNPKKIFFYPALPRTFKNIEVVCEAAKRLQERGFSSFEVWLTIGGNENKYAKKLYDNYKSIASLRFLGLLGREEVYKKYSIADCLIFPSKLETWGLPISEFKLFNKPILLADLPYAHETIGNYDKSVFFDPNNFEKLSELMLDLINNSIRFEKTNPPAIVPPFVENWEELFEILINEMSISESTQE